jgi:glycerol-3-phosphate dehydrogenase
MEAVQDCDLLVIGGGINGAGIARDAAGRGLNVILCEQGDLAQHTSSASTKLIHGGLRYLEHREFALVRKALREREVLLAAAPHIIWPLRFVMPHRDPDGDSRARPAWLIRAGLFLYDRLGGRQRLPPSHGVRLHAHPAGAPLDPALRRGFVYSDCWVQDARLVIANARDAAERGASVRPRTRCVAVQRGAEAWTATLDPSASPGGEGGAYRIRARALVNAAGPWVQGFADEATPAASPAAMQLVKGSHIVVPRLYPGDHAYLFQHSDGRVIFAIPYEQAFTLIGTTEVTYTGEPGEATITPEEVDYLCDAVNRYFAEPVRASDVVATYAGVRPLHGAAANADTSAVSRDYALELDTAGGATLLTVLGGKLTTHRVMAQEAVDRLAPVLGSGCGAWTAGAPLPGGDLPGGDFAAFLAGVQRRHPWLPEGTAWRLARNYGTRIERVLAGARELADLGECLGADLYEAELRYLVAAEWAQRAEDVLWRRTKLGLVTGAEETARVQHWLQAHAAVEQREAV